MKKALSMIAALGYSLLALGLLLLSPLGDQLPVEVWMFIHGQPLGEGRYLVLASGAINRTLEVTLIATGVLLVLASRTLRRSRR